MGWHRLRHAVCSGPSATPRPAHPPPDRPPPQESAAAERGGLAVLLEPLQDLCRAHAGGKGTYATALCARLIESFLEVEEKFETGGKSTEQEVIDSLRQVGCGAAGQGRG